MDKYSALKQSAGNAAWSVYNGKPSSVPAGCGFHSAVGMYVPRSQCDGIVTFLSDPAFVGSAYIQESLPKGNLVGDDDKIYFFFSEAGKEFDFFDNTVVSRIARVCKVSDTTGQIFPSENAFISLSNI